MTDKDPWLDDVRAAQDDLDRVVAAATEARDAAMARARQAGISHKRIGDAAAMSDANVIKILRRREAIR